MAISPCTLHFLPHSDPPYKLLQEHPSLALLSRCQNMHNLKQVHSHLIKTGLHHTQFAVSKLIEFCVVSPCADLSYALSVFDSVEEPNQFIWNTIIRGHSSSSTPLLALNFFIRMILSGVEPNSYTFPFLLKSCAKMAAVSVGEQIHTYVLKLGLDSDAFVHTSLIHMYAQNGELGSAQLVFDKSSKRDAISFTALITGYASKGLMEEAHRLFNEILTRDVVCWNAMIAGYAQSGRFEEALALFEEMRKSNVSYNDSTIVSVLSACAQLGSLKIGDSIRSQIENDYKFGSNLKLVNALIDMYAKCGDPCTARKLFDEIPQRDVISWNVMIGGYNHMGNCKEALSVFRQMLQSNEQPNDITFLAVLPACANLGALDLGQWIHAYINNKSSRISTNSSLCTSLIDMYAKCGDIEAAKQVFDDMNVKSLASWNSMIVGLAMHGRANAALELFSKMSREGVEPDDITFVGVLSACSHTGLVDLGRQYFSSMITNYRILPKLHHYGCMIDLLGRAGLFEEAKSMMKNMKIEPDGAIWGSLLGACIVHKQVEFGELAAQKLFVLEPDNPAVHVGLSNIYAGIGRWDEVARLRTLIKDKGMKKIPGCTSIEVDSVVHEFLVGDKAHPQSKAIYEMLDEMDKLLNASGFVSDTSEVLYDMDDEWKEGALSHHSEKLAIAFGLISTKPRTRITIVKNLRVCGNCHSATKLISKIFDREIIARDRNRFHHFKDGSCSCKDYWSRVGPASPSLPSVPES